jgi:hypothetical protein
MPYTETGVFLAGMVTMGFAMAGAFFIRFWRRAHEDRFLAFALAFWLLAVNQVVSVLRTGATDSGGPACAPLRTSACGREPNVRSWRQPAIGGRVRL